MRKLLTVAAIAGTAAVVIPSAATAATGPSTGDTTITINVSATSPNLFITFPATAALTLGTGSATNTSASQAALLTQAVYTGQIGNVKVTDDRALLTPSWNVKVSMTPFTNGAASVPAASSSYVPPLILAGFTTTGTVVPVGVANALSSTPTLAVTATGALNNTAQWNPYVTTDASLYTVAGTYTATLTHSVTTGLL